MNRWHLTPPRPAVDYFKDALLLCRLNTSEAPPLLSSYYYSCWGPQCWMPVPDRSNRIMRIMFSFRFHALLTRQGFQTNKRGCFFCLAARGFGDTQCVTAVFWQLSAKHRRPSTAFDHMVDHGRYHRHQPVLSFAPSGCFLNRQQAACQKIPDLHREPHAKTEGAHNRAEAPALWALSTL